MSDVLSRRALGRATLARQLLLARAEMPIPGAVEHLVGLQAQVPQNPYVALWSRLDGFRPEELARLLVERRVVRIVVLRATLHLVTADDALVLRPLTQPVLDRELARHREYAPLLDGVEIGAVLDFARDLLAERPRTGTQLRAALQERFPDQDAAALAYACRNHLALVQVPPRGLWGRTAQVTSTTLESWVGRPLATDASIDDLVVRYLAAFGPATTADVTTWSRLTGLAEVVERLRPRLRAFRDEDGRELVDLPDAPRPDPDTPAPVRFLPEYDNVLLSHADRSRLVTEHARAQVLRSPAPVHGAVLYDGGLCGTWRLERGPGAVASMVVNHVDPLAKRARAAVASEGRRLLRFLASAVEGEEMGEVRLEPLG
jgi:Winged helix DNA-binding domain